MAITTKQDNQAQLAFDLSQRGTLMGEGQASDFAQIYDPTNLALTLEAITSPDSVFENNAANATAQVVYDNNNDTVNTDTIPVATTVIFGDQGQTDTVTGTNAAHAINIGLDSAVTLTLNDAAADTVTVIGQDNAVLMGAAAGETVDLTAASTVNNLILTGGGLPQPPVALGAAFHNTVDMGGGANQTVNDAGASNTINGGQGANQVVNESGSGAVIGQGNNILLETGANTLVNNTGSNNTIDLGAGAGQTVQSTIGTGNVITAGRGDSQIIDESAQHNTIDDGSHATGEVGATNLQINALAGSNTFNLGLAASETVNVGGGGNTLAIAGGTGTTAINGVKLNDAVDFAVSQANLSSLSAQLNGNNETVTAHFNSGQVVTIEGAASTFPTTFNFAGVSVAVPAPTTSGPSQSLSTLTASPGTDPANGTSAITLTATELDASGKPISGATVAFSSTDTADVFTPVSAVTGANGIAIAQVTSTLAEADIISANLGSGVVETAGVTWTPTTPTPTTINLTSTEPTGTLQADGHDSVVYNGVVLDQFGNPVAAGQTVTVQQSGHAGLSSASLVTGTGGTFQETVTDTTAETPTVTFQDGSAVSGAHPTFTQPIPAAASAITISPASVAADGTSTETVQVALVDSNGVPISGQSVHLTSADTGDVIAAPTGFTDSSGHYSTTIASTTVSAADALTATEAATSTTQHGTAVFTSDPAGVPSSATSTISVAPSTIPADGISTGNIVVTVEDSTGAVIPNELVSLTAGAGDTLGAASGLTNSLGVFSTTIQSTTPNAADSIVATEGTATETTHVDFTTVAAPTTIVVSPTSSTVIGDGAGPAVITATVEDASGNPIAGTPYTVTDLVGSGTLSTTSGVTSPTGTITESVTDATPGDHNVIQFAAGSAAAQATVDATTPEPVEPASKMTLSSASTPADGATAVTVTTTLIDANGVPVSGEQVNFASTGAGDSFSQTSVTTGANGVAQTTLTSTSPGSDTISSVEENGATQSAVESFTSTVIPTTVNVTSPNLNSVADNVANVVLTATILDQHGVAVGAGQTVNVTETGHGTLSGTTLTTNALGQVVETIIDTTAESDAVTFTAGAATGSATAVFAAPVATTMTETASPTSVPADGTTKSTITATVFDQANNAMSGQTVHFSTTGGSLGVLSATTGSTGTATDTIIDHTAQAVSVTATDGTVHASSTVTFTGTGPQDSSSDMTSAALTTLLEGQGITAAEMSGILASIAPAADSLYPVESIVAPGVVPDISLVDATGNTDQPYFLDLLAANTSVNTNSFPSLSDIFDTSGGNLIVTGSHGVTILGDDPGLLLADQGTDTVIMGNKGADEVTMGSGHGSTVTFGTGLGDIGYTGTGSDQAMTDNSPGSFMHFGAGQAQSITLDGSNETVMGGSGSGDTVSIAVTATLATVIAGTGVGDQYTSKAIGTTFTDSNHGVAQFTDLAGGAQLHLGHGELSLAAVAGGNNTVGITSTAGAVVSITGLQATDTINFQASQAQSHVTQLGSELLVSTNAPGELVAMQFNSAAAAAAAEAAIHWAHAA